MIQDFYPLKLLASLLAAPTAIGLIGFLWGEVSSREKKLISDHGGNQPEPHEQGDTIGIIMVHGIGEQRRFQHIDGQMRGLLRSLRTLQQIGKVQQFSVDIAPGGAAAFGADQDTWSGGPTPSITVVIDHSINGKSERTTLLVHEVWWADVNEPYSLAKQIRFWLWGLSMWALPERVDANMLGSASRVAPPIVPRGSGVWGSVLWDRLRLWMVGVFFVLLGYTVGLASFLISRLLNLQTPNMLRVIANFVSGVKLYNQKRRFGPGLTWKRLEFIDSIDEPPRVSVRRRMIRTIADVACGASKRWYVLAHSQGTVVAFNGLMETAYAWPGYLDEARWADLKTRGMAGPLDTGALVPHGPFMPRRPVWALPNEIVYRSQIFERFSGFLTYGSPLEKFAGLWPALVPISRESGTFRENVPWINVYDPIDPVSGRLKAFKAQPPSCCPQPTDYGYAAHWVLLIAHLNYLTHRRVTSPSAVPDDLATRTVRWMLTDSIAPFQTTTTGWSLGTWYAEGTPQENVRSALAWLWWIVSAVLLAALASLVLPVVLHWVCSASHSLLVAIDNSYSKASSP